MSTDQTILIVDDSTTYRRLIAGLLKQWGYSVYEAENGEDALRALLSWPINLMISDWEMPVMDGLTLCRRVRAQFSDRYIYLILLTARESIDDLRAGFEAGANDFLRKPVNQIELQARLHAGQRILDLELMLAARNARLSEALKQIETDLQAAARLQQSILPAHNLRHGDYCADWLFVPSAYVSGDIFNLFPLNERYVGFYGVDVAGHGVGAAMVSLAVARQFLHGRSVEPFLFTHGQPAAPHEVVRILNQRFCAENDEVLSYFTMVYGVLDTRSGEGRLCQAGHPTPLIVRAGGEVVAVGEGGMPVGLMEGLTWDEQAFLLAPGDRLCLYSDGITECENPQHELFGQARLETLLAIEAQTPLAQLFPHISAALARWRAEAEALQATVTDDISLFIIEHLPVTEEKL
ncbi:PP2C family protein-serine/threonine phosphatase [Mixta tenebrionis]|uniref:Response regulator n=1 Tax=Mixta tenebrionis TaxID=2562439 RepID=A0A506VEF7_9GAMM|nr:MULTISPECIES: SpoIIE family protein phosphatase [Mixta]QHM75493.1 Chemotaxis protein CheY [Mixta theicola]TPW43373.1 response regulator [Mixta tenebrionis]